MSDRPSEILANNQFTKINPDFITDFGVASRLRKHFCILWSPDSAATYAIDEDGVIWVYASTNIDLSRLGFKNMSEEYLHLMF